MKDSIQRKETIFGTSAIYLIRPELGSFHYWLIATFPITFQIIETHYVSLGAELEIEVKDSKNRQTIFQKKFELKESNFRFIGDKLEVKEYKDFYKLNEKIIHEVGKEIITQFKRNQK
jgi:hypothetical protein